MIDKKAFKNCERVSGSKYCSPDERVNPSAGVLSCDSFGGLRWLLRPPHRRRDKGAMAGRWAYFRGANPTSGTTEDARCRR